jgi:hypothetical protein
MSPDDDSHLRSAFAELRRRNQVQAPSFETMRDRAMRDAEQMHKPARSFPILRLAGWATAVCAVVVSIWMVSFGGQRRGSNLGAAASRAAVDQIITRIEEHVDYHAAIALPEYPSDVLLTPP